MTRHLSNPCAHGFVVYLDGGGAGSELIAKEPKNYGEKLGERVLGLVILK